jgi:TctA family transporter
MAEKIASLPSPPLRPGPLLMTENPSFAWGLIASMYLGNIAPLAINIFAIPGQLRVTKQVERSPMVDAADHSRGALPR